MSEETNEIEQNEAHPEQRPDEIFWQNCLRDEEYTGGPENWKDIRYGERAYDVGGARCASMRPVFVRRAEIEGRIRDGHPRSAFYARVLQQGCWQTRAVVMEVLRTWEFL